MTYVVLGLIVAAWMTIAAAGAFPLLLLWFADFRYMDDPHDTISQAISAIGTEWLAAEGFEPEGAICPLGVRMALFRHRDNHTAIAVYFVAGMVVMDMVTAFPSNVGVETTSTGDGILVPLVPGTVMQCLPTQSLEERWHNHLQAVQLIQGHLNVERRSLGSLAEEVGDSQRRQIRHTFTHPWLILAIPYRYFVLRMRYRNLTVATQLERGWIDTGALFDLVRDR